MHIMKNTRNLVEHDRGSRFSSTKFRSLSIISGEHHVKAKRKQGAIGNVHINCCQCNLRIHFQYLQEKLLANSSGVVFQNIVCVLYKVCLPY